MKTTKPETDDDEVIDLEKHAKSGKKLPCGKVYRFRVDAEFFETRETELTGREILARAGKGPDRWLLNQKVRGSVLTVGPDDVVDLTTPGLERFMTLPIDQIEGELRKEFALPEDDVDQLDANGFEWETVAGVRGQRWLLIHRFPISEGYRQKEVSVAIAIPPGYPSGQLDMVWVSPALELESGGKIPATQHSEVIDGKRFQRWSRHYTGANPWKPDYNVVTHLLLARAWFARELERSAA
ncbi:multiubiquitin domain-containing protein [Pelagicoccus enzymogenes]|uniref:multiubiquitin domain-containing protein n=1 Tax=Pelagicoccus enzymogenes TaxID=2773457 RepID=UPI00280D993B|nr:multiubiquitin domain-containing protein [Pelagicoccus enzymogenes]MDQ8199372.1 multiubiquitin domain-containing protein [Pelagicoccus enzymogenes]